MSTLSSAQLDDLRAKAKLLLGISDDDPAFLADAVLIYHDESNSATAATVKVAYDDTNEVQQLTLDQVATPNSTDTFDLTAAANDTLAELVTAIDALDKGWVAEVLYKSDADSALLRQLAATDALGQSSAVTLEIENNELLDLLITNIFAGIETALHRDLLSTSFSELYDRPHNGTLVLQQPDVSAVTMVATKTNSGLTAKYTGSDTNARVEVTDTGVTITSRAGATSTSNAITFAAQVTTTAMASAINAVAGWTGAVVTDGPSAFLVRAGVVDAKDTQQTLEAWDDSGATYYTDYVAGILTFALPLIWCASSQIRIDYTAGFAELPADVEQAVLDAVKTAWDLGGVTTGLQSERLGDYSYQRAAGRLMSASQTAVAKAAEQLFTKYARFLP